MKRYTSINEFIRKLYLLDSVKLPAKLEVDLNFVVIWLRGTIYLLKSRATCTSSAHKMAGRGGHEKEATVTLCNALWGPKLIFQRGQGVVSFTNLLLTPSELVEAYREAKLHFASYELVALLLVTNSTEHLACLLDAKVCYLYSCCNI